MVQDDDEQVAQDGEHRVSGAVRGRWIVHEESTIGKRRAQGVVGHFESAVTKTPHPNPLPQERAEDDGPLGSAGNDHRDPLPSRALQGMDRRVGDRGRNRVLAGRRWVARQVTDSTAFGHNGWRRSDEASGGVGSASSGIDYPGADDERKRVRDRRHKGNESASTTLLTFTWGPSIDPA